MLDVVRAQKYGEKGNMRELQKENTKGVTDNTEHVELTEDMKFLKFTKFTRTDNDDDDDHQLLLRLH